MFSLLTAGIVYTNIAIGLGLVYFVFRLIYNIRFSCNPTVNLSWGKPIILSLLILNCLSVWSCGQLVY